MPKPIVPCTVNLPATTVTFGTASHERHIKFSVPTVSRAATPTVQLQAPTFNPANHNAEIRTIRVDNGATRKHSTVVADSVTTAALLFFPHPIAINLPGANCTLTVIVTIWNKPDKRRQNFHRLVSVQTLTLAVGP